MDFSSSTTSGGGGGGGSGGGGKSYNPSHHQHLHGHHHAGHHTAHHLHHHPHSVSGGHVSPPSQLGQLAAVGPSASLIKAEESTAGNMTTASPALAGFGVSAAGVNLSVNIGVNITGVTPESAAAPWATAAAYTSRSIPKFCSLTWKTGQFDDLYLLFLDSRLLPIRQHWNN